MQRAAWLRAVAGATVLALAACGGGAQNALPVGGGAGTQGKNGVLTIALHVPGSSVQTRHGRHQLTNDASRDTQGIGVEYVSHGSALPGDTTPTYGQSVGAGAPGCDATAGTDGSFNCNSITIPIAPGVDDVRITLWNAQPTGCASGSGVTSHGTGCSFSAAKSFSQWDSLGSNPSGYAILQGQSNTLSFTLDPVVNGAVVMLSNGFTDGQPETPAATAYLMFTDANGNIILGTNQLIDANGNNLTVTLNIANNLGGVGCNAWNSTPCSLYFNQLTQPSFTSAGASGDSVQINFDGAKTFPISGSVPQVTIGGLGTVAGAVVPATFEVTGASSSGSLSIPGAIASIGAVSSGTGPTGIAVDANGGLWDSYYTTTPQIELYMPLVGAAPTLSDSSSGTSFYYRVVFKRSAVDANGTNTAAYADAITQVSAEAGSSVNTGTLTIGTPPAGTALMDIYRGTTSGTETLLASDSAVATTYTDAGGAAGVVALPTISSGSDGSAFITAGPFTGPASNSSYDIALAHNGYPCVTSNYEPNVNCFDPVLATWSTYTTTGNPTGIALGPDGNIWFTEPTSNKIGTVNVAAASGTAASEFSGSTPFGDPYGISAGPDGNLWVTNLLGNRVSVVSPTRCLAGTCTYTTSYGSGALDAPGLIIEGSDGNMWISNQNAASVTAITPSGSATEYSIASFGANTTTAVASGPGSYLYVTSDNGLVAQISTAGSVGSTLTVTSPYVPYGIVDDPLTARLYVTNLGAHTLDYFTP